MFVRKYANVACLGQTRRTGQFNETSHDVVACLGKLLGFALVTMRMMMPWDLSGIDVACFIGQQRR